MKLVMVKAGYYLILLDVEDDTFLDGRTLHLIKSKIVNVDSPWRYETKWFLDDQPTAYDSLKQLLFFLNLEWSNYPGPLKILQKVKEYEYSRKY